MKDGWTETGGIIGGGGVCQLKPGNKEVTQSRSGENVRALWHMVSGEFNVEPTPIGLSRTDLRHRI